MVIGCLLLVLVFLCFKRLEQENKPVSPCFKWMHEEKEQNKFRKDKTERKQHWAIR